MNVITSNVKRPACGSPILMSKKTLGLEGLCACSGFILAACLTSSSRFAIVVASVQTENNLEQTATITAAMQTDRMIYCARAWRTRCCSPAYHRPPASWGNHLGLCAVFRYSRKFLIMSDISHVIIHKMVAVIVVYQVANLFRTQARSHSLLDFDILQ